MLRTSEKVDGEESNVDTEVVGRVSCGKISIIQHHHDCGCEIF